MLKIVSLWKISYVRGQIAGWFPQFFLAVSLAYVNPLHEHILTIVFDIPCFQRTQFGLVDVIFVFSLRCKLPPIFFAAGKGPPFIASYLPLSSRVGFFLPLFVFYPVSFLAWQCTGIFARSCQKRVVNPASGPTPRLSPLGDLL